MVFLINSLGFSRCPGELGPVIFQSWKYPNIVRLYDLPSRINQCSSGGSAETFGFASEQYKRLPVIQHISVPHLNYIEQEISHLPQLFAHAV